MSEGSENQDDELEGAWTVISGMYKGKPFDGYVEWTFNRGTIWITPLGKAPFPVFYRVFSERVPKGINVAARIPGKPWMLAKGIYEVEGGNLRICLPSSPNTEPYKQRPTDFEPGADRDLWVFRRKGEGDSDRKQQPKPVGLLRRLTSMFRRRPNA
jgi:uncharacterized protein (TIGR03067 family)